MLPRRAPDPEFALLEIHMGKKDKDKENEVPVVKVYLAPGARLPSRSTPGAAGYDVHACLEPDTYIELGPLERLTVPTGLYFEIPGGYFISLRPRSGLALNQGLTLLNSPATIDSDYRGELRALLINLGSAVVRINNGDRIAQLLVEKIQDFRWERVTRPAELEDSQRGSGGFGSTGLA